MPDDAGRSLSSTEEAAMSGCRHVLTSKAWCETCGEYVADEVRAERLLLALGRQLSCGCTGTCPHSEYPEPVKGRGPSCFICDGTGPLREGQGGLLVCVSPCTSGRTPSCRDCRRPLQDSDECRVSGLCLLCLNGPPAPPVVSSDECCASGRCEVCAPGGFGGSRYW